MKKIMALLLLIIVFASCKTEEPEVIEEMILYIIGQDERIASLEKRESKPPRKQRNDNKKIKTERNDHEKAKH